MTNGERIMAYAADGKRFTTYDIHRDLGILPRTIGTAICALVRGGQLEVAELTGKALKGQPRVMYRATEISASADLWDLVLFGGARRQA